MGSRATEAYRRSAAADGRPLSTKDREQLVKPYLPEPRSLDDSSGSPVAQHRRPNLQKQKEVRARDLLGLLLHKLLFHTVQLAFTIYICVRQAYHAVLDRVFAVLYYHHRTPELIRRDVKNLGKLPRHLSVIVDVQGEDGRGKATPEGISKLIADTAELASWCACVGIPMLSVYERSGALKSHISTLQSRATQTFNAYFPTASQPTLTIRTPQQPAEAATNSTRADDSASETSGTHLDLLLLSSIDGRTTLVDLTKTLTEMAQRGKISPGDVSSELIQEQIESTCREPDLLVVMAGGPNAVGPGSVRRRRRRRRSSNKTDASSGNVEPDAEVHGANGCGICLRGYPPWQVRLTEIFQVQDNAGVGYQVFLRALHRYAKAEMRFGG